MKKLYRKSTVHPSPPATPDQYLAFLPATILALATALPPEEVEVLAYLISISCSSINHPNFSDRRKNRANGKGSEVDHAPMFSCDCFRCYKSYWVRWDSSSNRKIIHEILDAYEDGLAQGNQGKGKKVRKRRNGGGNDDSGEFRRQGLKEVEAVDGGSGGGGDVEEGGEKGSVRKIVSFIGEKIWGVFG